MPTSEWGSLAQPATREHRQEELPECAAVPAQGDRALDCLLMDTAGELGVALGDLEHFPELQCHG